MFRSREAEFEKELFRGCEAGDVDRVRRTIAAGVDPRKATNKDWFEETPLHSIQVMSLFNRRGSGWYIDPHPHLSTLLPL